MAIAIRSQKEIDDVLNACWEQDEKGGSRWPGMTYEEGVKAAIEWMTRLEQPNPMVDE